MFVDDFELPISSNQPGNLNSTMEDSMSLRRPPRVRGPQVLTSTSLLIEGPLALLGPAWQSEQYYGGATPCHSTTSSSAGAPGSNSSPKGPLAPSM